ncbi:hypothetical protein ACKVMH_03765 [Lysobacter zhanggongensis]|uniref:Uncharacterized protein n=1 Tax=Lysobacter zhanggongensis TaxID=1774951 RepID=A0ABU7YPR3_9GAMM
MIVGLAGIYLLPTAGPRGTTSASRGLPIASTENRVAALEARVEQLSLRLERLSRSGSPGRVPYALSPAPYEEPAPASEHAHALRQAEQELSALLNAEGVDPRWSTATEQALQRIGRSDAILAIEARPPERQMVDCRHTRCRIEFDFADRADAEDWTLAYLTSLGGTLPRSQYFVSNTPGGRTRITLYGQR